MSEVACPKEDKMSPSWAEEEGSQERVKVMLFTEETVVLLAARDDDIGV